MPITRVKALQPLSREHHHSLLLCWKIKTGIQKGVATERIRSYAFWYYTAHLKNHFAQEELFIFPILGFEHPLICEAMEHHEKLRGLFNSNLDLATLLSDLEKTLTHHIRFEERVLFNAIQEAASEDQLRLLQVQDAHSKFEDNLEDPFWE